MGARWDRISGVQVQKYGSGPWILVRLCAFFPATRLARKIASENEHLSKPGPKLSPISLARQGDPHVTLLFLNSTALVDV